jgi:sugar phosphate isomerase/epimerase
MISVSSPVFSLLDFEMALGFIDQEFDAWEIVGEGRHFLPFVEENFLDAVSSHDLKFSAHAPLSDINIGSLNPRIREAAVREVTNTIRSAHRLNIGVVTVHPGFYSPLGLLDKPSVLERTFDSLRSIERASKEFGVRVALENMPAMGPMTMGRTPEELFTLLDSFDIDICFDIGHAHTMNAIEDFLEHKACFANVHVHDNMGQSDQHLPVGEGNIDFQKVLKGLSGYQGKYVIEARSLNDAVVSRDRLKHIFASIN